MPNMVAYLHVCPSIHRFMGSAPVVVQCPLTSSPGEFPGYWDWFCYPAWAFARVGVHRLSLLPSIFRCFSIHSSSPATEFHSCFFFTTDVSAPIRLPFTYSLFR